MNRWTPEAVADAFRRAGKTPPQDLGEVKRVSKWRSRKKEIDGHVFDSCAEAKAYQDLKLQQATGFIADLKLQPRFLLQAGFRDTNGKWHRKIEYVADFDFQRTAGDHTGRVVVDVKGARTPMFRLKEKLFREKYPTITFEIWDTRRKRRKP